MHEDESTDIVASTPAERSAKVLLVAVVDGCVCEWDLSKAGVYRIGRTLEAEVKIDSTSVSRDHADLEVHAVGATVTDLGSTNGTFVNDVRVEKGKQFPLQSGDLVRFGRIAAQVHGARRELEKAEHFVTPQVFAKRLADEAERALRSNQTISALVIECTNATVTDAARAFLAKRLRRLDFATQRTPCRLDVLVVNCAHEDVERIGQELLANARDNGLDVCVGTASYPTHAPSPDSLIPSAHLAIENTDVPPEELDAQPSGIAGVIARTIRIGDRSIVVAEPEMIRLYGMIDRLASAKNPVLVYGETGTGKELVAEALHDAGQRSDGALVKVNCAAIPAELLESELFGHEKGAFSGANARRVGLIEQADGGTLFLDEIAEMPLALQAKLLRVLEDQRVRRVGGSQEIVVDARIVAATHCQLPEMVAEKRFRQDLYFRLRGIELRIPPLRERPAEIQLLAGLFLRDGCRIQGRPVMSFTAAAEAALQQHAWPGNVRELRQVVEAAILLCDGGAVDACHLQGVAPPKKVSTRRKKRETDFLEATAPGAQLADGEAAAWDFSVPLSEEIKQLERRRIEEALAAADGNRTKAAKLLGMPRRTLVHKLGTLGINGSA